MDKRPAASTEVVRRVNILAFPVPTTGLYLLLIAALLAVGLFVGSWMHNLVLGREWIQAVSSCLDLDVDQQRSCSSPAEIRRGLWSLAGALLIAGLAVAVLYTTPSVMSRRRSLKLPLPKHQAVVDRFAELASQAKLRRVPTLYLGPARMGDAFSFGRPGYPAVALPPKVVGLLVRPGPADGVVLHEFAHIRHRDVELAWMARSAWYVSLLVLAVPIVGALWEGPSILPYYVWRAALLAVVVEIVTAALLRAREHDADLRASAEPQLFEVVRSGLGLLGAGTPRNWLRRLRARHPTRTERFDALESPHIVASSSFFQALTAGLLAGVLGPLVVSTATPLLSGTDIVLGGIWMSAIVTGSLLGLTVGLDIWRSQYAAFLARGTNGQGRPTMRGVFLTAAGVSVGLALGQLVSLAGIGQDVSAPLDPITFVAPLIAGLGTVFICAAFGTLCLPLAFLVTRPWHFWFPALVLNVVIFIVTTWISESLGLALVGFGWLGAYLWIQYGYDEWPGFGLAVLLAGVAFLASLLGIMSRHRGAPDWMYIADHTSAATAHPVPAPSATGSMLRFPLLLGLCIGLAGSIFLVLQLLLVNTSTTEGAVQADFLWVSTTMFCWIASGATLSLFDPVAGPAKTFIAGPLSLALCALGVAVFWFASSGSVPMDHLMSIWAPAMANGLAVSIITVGLAVPVRYAVSVATRHLHRPAGRKRR